MKVHKAIVLFFQLAFDLSLIWHERAADNLVETKKQDHNSWLRIHEFSFTELLLSSTLHVFEV